MLSFSIFIFALLFPLLPDFDVTCLQAETSNLGELSKHSQSSLCCRWARPSNPVCSAPIPLALSHPAACPSGHASLPLQLVAESQARVLPASSGVCIPLQFHVRLPCA